MLSQLFKDQRQYLNHFFDTVAIEEVEAVFDKLLHCPGILVLSGVGKSGHIAQKVATTLSSTGTRAMFLSPTHALHGDIGLLTPHDAFLAFSKSGESQELLDLIPSVAKRGALRISVVSSFGSRLEKASDLTVHLPVQRELCPYDLAPTTSTAVQLLFGDCLAIALMRAKRFSAEDFVANHPAGFLGKKMTLRVSDLMLKDSDIPLCKPTDRLLDVLHELSVKRCGCLLVAEERQLKGIFTDGDLRRALQSKGPQALQQAVGELMTQTPRFTTPHQLAFDAMRQMEEDPAHLITVLPVLEDGKIKGLLRMHDVLQAGLH